MCHQIRAFARVFWCTVLAICQRVSEDVLDPDRLEGVVEIGVDEISWRTHHRYLTAVCDHDTGKVVWGKLGKDPRSVGRLMRWLWARCLLTTRGYVRCRRGSLHSTQMSWSRRALSRSRAWRSDSCSRPAPDTGNSDNRAGLSVRARAAVPLASWPGVRVDLT